MTLNHEYGPEGIRKSTKKGTRKGFSAEGAACAENAERNKRILLCALCVLCVLCANASLLRALRTFAVHTLLRLCGYSSIHYLRVMREGRARREAGYRERP